MRRYIVAGLKYQQITNDIDTKIIFFSHNLLPENMPPKDKHIQTSPKQGTKKRLRTALPPIRRMRSPPEAFYSHYFLVNTINSLNYWPHFAFHRVKNSIRTIFRCCTSCVEMWVIQMWYRCVSLNENFTHFILYYEGMGKYTFLQNVFHAMQKLANLKMV